MLTKKICEHFSIFFLFFIHFFFVLKSSETYAGNYLPSTLFEGGGSADQYLGQGHYETSIVKFSDYACAFEFVVFNSCLIRQRVAIQRHDRPLYLEHSLPRIVLPAWRSLLFSWRPKKFYWCKYHFVPLFFHAV